MSIGASPLTFIEQQFLRVHIQADMNVTTKAEHFDFEGANVGFSIKHGKGSDDTWWVGVGFRTLNPEDAEVSCPYLIDIMAMGRFEISKKWPIEKHEKLVYEYGAALVYGTIRDIVLTITSRGMRGALMLPTPTFANEFENYLKSKEKNPSNEAKPKEARPKKATRQKKVKKAT